MPSRNPLVELYKSRVREIWREPEVLFWIFGFPVLLAVGLGIAFRDKPPDEIAVAVIDAPGSAQVVEALRAQPGFQVDVIAQEEAGTSLRMGRVGLVVVPSNPPEYRFDPTR